MKITDTLGYSVEIDLDIEKLRAVRQYRAALIDAEQDERVARAEMAECADEEKELAAARERLEQAEAAAKNYRAKLAEVEPYWKEKRRQCQTDDLFLSHLLGYVRISMAVHGEMFDCHVNPNPDKPVEKWDTVKVFADLDPRGVFKSTVSIIRSVKCIICCPEIAICKLTATKPLAKAIANEIRDHFVHDPNAEPSAFQMLFPEFTLTPGKASEGSYTAPCRTWKRREATVMAFSIETSISGWHFDLQDPDDVVDTVNSGTPGGLKKVKKNYRINKKTLMPWGYTNLKGTVYDPMDLNRDVVEKARPGKTKVLVRGAMKIKARHGERPERLQPGMDFPAPENVELLFPQLLSYEFLKGEFEDDPESFITQYMNDAYGGRDVTWTIEDMLAATDEEENAPVTGQVEMAWRFAYSGKPSMKLNCGVAGIMDNGRMTIIDVVRGTFKPTALAHKVVMMAKKHGQHRVKIEATPGAMQMEPHIKNYAVTLQWPLEIGWLEFEEDDGIRELRIKSTEPLTATKRLRFSAGIRVLSEVYRQFCNLGVVEENEITDVVARVAEVLPRSIVPEQQDREQDMNWELAKLRDMHDRTHGIGRYAPMQPLETEKPYRPNDNGLGLEDIFSGALNA